MAYGFMQRGLVAALLVGVVCAVMGTFVVLKGLAFIGDAVSHAAFPGLVIAYIVGAPLYIGGAVAAVATALAIGLVSRRGRLRFDTAVGVLFAGTFAFGVLLFSTIKGYVADLLGYLLGNVLGIGIGDLIQVAVLGAHRAGRSCWRCARSCCSRRSIRSAPRHRGCRWRALEYLLLALLGVTIVVSIQAVGIIMVVAMLVTPAATAQLLVVRFDRMMALGASSWRRCRRSSGCTSSFYLNLASGASIVLVETLFFVIALVLGPKTGLLSRACTPTRGRRAVGSPGGQSAG